MRSLSLLALASLTLAACDNTDRMTAPEAPSLATAAATHRYRVTIANLTSGQPLSPGVVVTHTKKVSLFTMGATASEGIRFIAESGDPTTAVAELAGVPGFHEVVATSVPVGRVGGGPFPGSLTIEIGAAAEANYLSLSLMLICTNDGFAGLDAVRLPGGFQESVFYAQGYDAGTEVNTETAGSIVPPCFAIGPVQGPVGGPGRTAEGGVIQMHPGILGIADLTSAHRWTGPVARIAVQRIK